MRQRKGIPTAAVVAIGVVGALALSACGGTRNRASDLAPAPAVAGAPALSLTQAEDVVVRFRPELARAFARNDPAAIGRLESKAALGETLADERSATVQEGVPDELAHDLGEATIYRPAGGSFPQWFLAAAPFTDDPGRTEFDVFERVAPTAPWRETMHTLATAHALGTPATAGGVLVTASGGETARVSTALTAVGSYLASGQAPASLTDTLLAEPDADLLQERRLLDADFETGSRVCSTDPAQMLRVVHTLDGASQGFGVLDCRLTWRAKPGHLLDLPLALRAWTSRTHGRRSFTYHEKVQVGVAVQPDGTTQVIGYWRALVDVTVE